MEHKRYNEIKDEKRIRVVSITEEQAEKLNSQSKITGISYKLEKESKNKKTIDIDTYSLNLSDVIEAYNSLENVKAIGGNTGVKKVSDLIEKLSDEQLTDLLSKAIK